MKKILIASLVFFTFGFDMAYAESISLWTRMKGDYTNGKVHGKVKPIKINLDALKLEKRTIKDVHYNKDKTYLGVPVLDLITTYKPSLKLNLALLHFANGIIYPIRLEERQAIEHIFVAKKMLQGKKFVAKFPNASLTQSIRGKKREIKIQFTTSKIAAPKNWLLLGKNKEPIHKHFNPIQHADRLVGIEFADAEAYYNQFKVADVQGYFYGRVSYIGRCQYCHSVRGIGPKFGRDFVQGTPIYQSIKPIDLFRQVKRPDRGVSAQLMPHQPDFTISEAKDLWRWLRDVTDRELLPYNP